MAACHAAGEPVRAVGTGLSPNGIAFSNATLLSMAGCNRLVRVDAEKRQVTVEAGMRVCELTEALRPHGLALQTCVTARARVRSCACTCVLTLAPHTAAGTPRSASSRLAG